MRHQGSGTHLALQLDVPLEMQRAGLPATLQLKRCKENDVVLPWEVSGNKLRGGVVQRKHYVAKLAVHDRHGILFFGFETETEVGVILPSPSGSGINTRDGDCTPGPLAAGALKFIYKMYYLNVWFISECLMECLVYFAWNVCMQCIADSLRSARGSLRSPRDVVCFARPQTARL